MLDEFVAYPAHAKRLLLACGSAIFAVLGLWMAGLFGTVPTSVRYSHDMIVSVGWLCFILFGLCSIAWLIGSFAKGAAVVIGLEGIRCTSWSDALIPWSEIKDVNVWAYNKKQRSIILVLYAPDRFPGKPIPALLQGVNRKLTGGDVFINLTGTDRSFEDAMAAVSRFRVANKV